MKYEPWQSYYTRRLVKMKFPLIIKWAITDKCNFTCKHCYRSERHEEITKEESDIIIEELSKNKIACVALTGGEPLIAKEFAYIVKKLNEKKINTEIATNGYLISEDTIRLFKENNIQTLQISLEGPDAKTNDFIRGEGTYNIVVKSIKALRNAGINVILANTLNHYNCMLSDKMVKLAEKLNVSALRFEIYIPVRYDKYNLNLTTEDLAYIQQKFDMYSRKKNIILPSYHDGNNCGAGKYMAMINSDMTISPCDLLCDEIKSSQQISQESSIKKIWQDDVVLEDWRKHEYKGCAVVEKKCKIDKKYFEGVYM